MQEIARWNSERDCWETSEVDLLSGLPVVFSETWPASATMRNNILYLPQKSAHHMADSGSLFSQLGGKILPTPVAQPSGNTPEDHLRKKPGRGIVTDLAIIVENDLIESGGKLLPTPRANEATGIGIHGTGGQDLRTTISLLPTPDAYAGSRGGAQDPAKRRAGGHSVALHDVIEKGGLLPTPRATRGGSATETISLLPTPKAGDADFGMPRTSGRPPEKSTHLMTGLENTLNRSDEIGDSDEGRPNQVLQDMRRPALPQEVREREDGRSECLPKEVSLFPDLCKQPDRCPGKHAQMEG